MSRSVGTPSSWLGTSGRGFLKASSTNDPSGGTHMHRKHLVAAVAAVALAGTALGGPASAEDPAAKPKPNVVVNGLVSPLSLAVTDDGTVYYAQNFAGMLLSKKRGKQPKVVYQDPD